MILIHPFEDGNGRLHRYLLQRVLGERGVAPCGVALPLSKAIWNDMEGYVEALESCQTDRLDLIEWKPTANGNVDVTIDTADLYRYFAASVDGRFLMKCIDRVFERDIPRHLRIYPRTPGAGFKLPSGSEPSEATNRLSCSFSPSIRIVSSVTSTRATMDCRACFAMARLLPCRISLALLDKASIFAGVTAGLAARTDSACFNARSTSFASRKALAKFC
jgi:hypothetical protein